MKFYVLGFIFNRSKNEVLLIEKKRPKWQAGYWNGIGGKIEPKFDKTPLAAMRRECEEETGSSGYMWEHCITFTCPGGTVFVYKAISQYGFIRWDQLETELLRVYSIDNLPEKLMANLKWIIPVCLSTIQFPLIVQQNTLGCDG